MQAHNRRSNLCRHTKTATAQIKGLDKNTANEIKSSGGFDWKATCTNVTNYTVKVAATPAVKLNEESDGTYTLSQNATVSLPSVDNSTRPVIAVTATTKDSSYTCAQSFTVKIPYSKIDVEFVEDASGTNNSSYDSNSSTLYIDQEESATLSLLLNRMTMMIQLMLQSVTRQIKI